MSIKMGGTMEIQKSIYDGTNFAQYAQGNKAPNDEKGAKDAALKGMEIPEYQYLELGATVVLNGVEKVGEAYAYVVEVTLPSGAKSLEYFDVESGLKVRSTQFVKGPQGEVAMSQDYKDYQEVDGILFPFTRILPLGGGMTLDAKVDSIKLNSGVPDSTFKIE